MLLLIVGCSTLTKTSEPAIGEIRDLPELVVKAPRLDEQGQEPLFPYRSEEDRPFRLIHTSLDLAFDWEKQHVLGRAELRMTPHAYPQDSVVLDAVGFLLHEVRQAGARDTLAYRHDNLRMYIYLPETAEPGDTLDLIIAYTARPEENPSGGSAAIQSDKGLYFINPTGQHRDKPTQIWTQGETQSNSKWFPTFDQPNIRSTQEIRVRVDTAYLTLSNGLLVDQQWHPDGTRTDTWRQELSHAPYLFMLAIGEYAYAEDTWNGIPLGYYVEKDYEAHVRAIFPDAPAMLQFFSDYVGVTYPWDKYSQVVVRDYVSGAMENTSAVIYGEFMQMTTRELIDERRNELIGAHELIHHWFGDLVTCESWSNLVLNEGFANYGEYLWLEHKYGLDEAEHHRRQELYGYLNEASRKRRALVDFHWAEREDMFDAHSYNKGGLVLHMLRHYLGDRVFRAGVRRYLEQNAYQSVEVHDLRLAMEFVSGRDLNWFFNQWFFEPGHPVVEMSWEYEEAEGLLRLDVAQIQDPADNAHTYRLPTEIAVLFAGDSIVYLPLTIDQREQTFWIAVGQAPLLVEFDPHRHLLAEREIAMDALASKAYWRMRPGLWVRQDILGLLETEAWDLEPHPRFDAHWTTRAMATGLMYLPEDQLELASMVRRDAHSEVRDAALSQLHALGFQGIGSLALDRAQSDSSYQVLQKALSILALEDPASATSVARSLEEDGSTTATYITAAYYAERGDVDGLRFFEQSWDRINGYARLTYIKLYIDLLQVADKDMMRAGVDRLREEALARHWSPVRRFAATRGIAILRQAVMGADPAFAEELQGHIRQIKETETDTQLRRFYMNY
jgi:aminopeptidase N